MEFFYGQKFQKIAPLIHSSFFYGNGTVFKYTPRCYATSIKS